MSFIYDAFKSICQKTSPHSQPEYPTFKSICQKTYPHIQPKEGYTYENLYSAIQKIRKLQFKADFHNAQRTLFSNVSEEPTYEMVLSLKRSDEQLNKAQDVLAAMAVMGSTASYIHPERNLGYLTEQGFEKETEFSGALKECRDESTCVHPFDCGMAYHNPNSDLGRQLAEELRKKEAVAATENELVLSAASPAKKVAEPWQAMANRLQTNERRTCIQELIEARRRLTREPTNEFQPSRFLEKTSKLKHAYIENSTVSKADLAKDGVFLTANEMGHKKIRDLLKTVEKLSGGHFGISGLHNWDQIAYMRSGFAVLVDYNPKVIQFHQNMLKILISAKNGEDFVNRALEQIKKDLEVDPDFYTPNGLYPFYHGFLDENRLGKHVFELRRMLNRENGALSPKNFHYLKKLAKEGKIIPLQLDICDVEAMKTIADAVHEQGLVFSSLYLSNCYDYLKKDPELSKAFKKSVEVLKQDGTCIIDSTLKGNGIFGVKILAHLHYGKDPETGNPFDPDISRGLVDADHVNVKTYYKQPAPLDAFTLSKDD